MMREMDRETGFDLEGLWGVFRERYPRLNSQQLAAVVVEFLERTPHSATVCDDGAVVRNEAEVILEEVQALIRQLKAFAGPAYPYTVTEADFEPGDPEELAHGDIATCIGCGCDDFHACWDDDAGEPCHWLRVNYAAGLGVCSACPEAVSDWDAVDREVKVPLDRLTGKDE